MTVGTATCEHCQREFTYEFRGANRYAPPNYCSQRCNQMRFSNRQGISPTPALSNKIDLSKYKP